LRISLLFCSAIFLWSLLCYQSSSLSLFNIDSTQKVLWYEWLLSSVAAILFYLIGASAWVLPFFCGYISVVWFFSSWKAEWDRLVASIIFVFTSCFLWSLSLGIVWRGSLLKGGILGDWLVLRVMPFDSIIQWIVGIAVLLISLIVMSRFMFMIPVYYVVHLSASVLKHNSIVRRVCLSAWNLIIWLGGRCYCVVRWGFRLVTGKNVEDDYAILFDQEELEQLSSLEDIVNDVVWQSKKIAKPERRSTVIKQDDMYSFPDRTLFAALRTEEDSGVRQEFLKNQGVILEKKLLHFGVEGKVAAIKPGPIVTCFEYEPKIDTKLSKITALEDDLALALEAVSLRILAPVPGTSVVGFEVANKKRNSVLMASIVSSAAYANFAGVLPLILGKDTIGRDVVVDLAQMPHLLIAGSTGSGKSVALNVMLMSLLCRKTPDELKLILIDPKRLEFSAYADTAHLLFPIVTMPKRAIQILQWVVKTMEDRYEFMAQKGVRNIKDYHMRYGVDAVKDMPYIVVVIDELADLMMTAGKQVEERLARIAQMARASGIHVIVATQRPSVDVITGLIKVNFPSRISFRVTSKVDSRTILDRVGAEKLLGRGDMLFINSQSSELRRVHGAFVSDDEIARVVAHVQGQRSASYLNIAISSSSEDQLIRSEDDELFHEVLSFLDEIDEISISLLQRRFRIGFNRSARIIEALEAQGLIMVSDGGKTRKVVR